MKHIQNLKAFASAFSLFLCAFTATAADFKAPAAGTLFSVSSSSSGELTQEVVSAESDRFVLRTKNTTTGNSTDSVFLFGLLQLSKDNREGVFRADVEKLKAFFPLEVGKSVSLSSYGTTNGQRWFRDNFVQVVSEQSILIGDDVTKGFQIKYHLKSAAGDFFNFEGTCLYSVPLGLCVVLDGELKLRNRPEMNGPQKTQVTSVTLNGQTRPIKVDQPNL